MRDRQPLQAAAAHAAEPQEATRDRYPQVVGARAVVCPAVAVTLRAHQRKRLQAGGRSVAFPLPATTQRAVQVPHPLRLADAQAAVVIQEAIRRLRRAEFPAVADRCPSIRGTGLLKLVVARVPGRLVGSMGVLGSSGVVLVVHPRRRGFPVGRRRGSGVIPRRRGTASRRTTGSRRDLVDRRDLRDTANRRARARR
ncbi:hypothetical protein LV79_003578 [Actinokineospora globicatena]|nr:hypothetical protein [Actinokineospora globicatena]GLW78969.1 hypothetical protein Aglo01_34510 [Actinokineospora globicatena]GLW86620.1 hypothetical protein Aglo02_42590 [Actinokineospora globicatena]